MTVTNNKKLEAAHHKWLRRILGITRKQSITNEEVRQRTGIVGMGKIEEIFRRNRLSGWATYIEWKKTDSLVRR